MKTSSLKIFISIFLTAGLFVAMPDISLAQTFGDSGSQTGGGSIGGGSIGGGDDSSGSENDDLSKQLNIQEGGTQGVGDSVGQVIDSAIDRGKNCKGIWGCLVEGVKIFTVDVAVAVETAGGTKMSYTDPFTGKTEEYVITVWGSAESTAGNTKGCSPLPVKWVESRKCLFCPLFAVLYDAANNMSMLSFEKLAVPIATVMLVGFAIWIAMKVIAHVSSLTKQDAPKFLVGLINQSFKVMIAYLLLTNAHAIYYYGILPVLSAGLDFGSAVLFNVENFSDCTASAAVSDGKSLLSAALGEKLQCFVRKIQEEVGFMQAIGSTLMCVGRHEGKIDGLIWDFGMVFQGLVLYAFALALSLAFAFYLIDATVQLGLVGALMPLLIACWPFGPTVQYTKKGWEMFLNSFFVYAFLGIVVSINMQMVAQAITNSGEAAASIAAEGMAKSGCDGEKTGLLQLACVISNNDMETLKKLTDLGFGGFLILLCCCIFGFKFTSQSTALAAKMASGGIDGIGNKIGGLAASGTGKLAAKATQPARNAISRGARKVLDGAGEKIGNGAKMIGSAIGSSKVGRAAKSMAGSGVAAAAKVAGGALGVHRGKDGKGTAGANRKTKNNPLARKMVASMLKKSRQLKGK